MVLFLDKNYLNEAVQHKRNILSRYLLTVPRYSTEVYPHNGTIRSNDSKHRLPWEKTKGDTDFLHEESLKLKAESDGLKAGISSNFHPEPFDRNKSLNDSITECVNFDLDSDVIPSSNPSSPDLFINDETTAGSSIIQETFRKEEPPVLSFSNDNLKLETFLTTQNDDKLPSQRPDLAKLTDRLKPMVVSDPLQDKDGNPTKEQNLFSTRSVYLIQHDEKGIDSEQSDLSIITDVFEKQQTSAPLQKLDLEDIVTENIELPKKDEVYLALNTTLQTKLVSLKPLEIEKDQSLKQVTKRLIKNTKDVSVDMIPYSAPTIEDEQISFMDINEPDFTEEDELCEEAYLDTPVETSPVSCDERQYPTCTAVDLETSTPVLLEAKKKHHFHRVHFSSELCFGEVHSYSLTVPYSFESEIEPSIEATYIHQVTQLVKLDQCTTASTDLHLGWDLATLSDIRKDPSRMFDKLKIEGIVRPKICEVEVFEKALLEDFYDQSEDVQTDESECELESLHSVDDNDNAQGPSQHVETTSIGTEMNRNEHPIPLDTGQQNTVKASDDCKSNLVKNVKMSTNLPTRQKFDPLENFLALRCKKNKMVASGNVLTESISIPTEVQKLPVVQDPPPEKLQEELTKPCPRQVSVKTKKTKHHLVTVKQSDAYRSLVTMLEREATKYLSVLKTDNAVPQSCSFQTLTPDVTRFLVKQREKYHADNNIEASEDSVYRSILCVHGLVGTTEILVTCCLESALGFLNAFHDRYQHAVKNSLDGIHQGLLQCREKFGQQQILHPKLSAICKEIETWLKKKRTKSGDNEQKILVIVKKDMLSLKNSLKRVLNLSKLLDPHVLETADANLLIESLDDHNCLIVHTQQIAETFPWAQFCLVVEYEYQEAANWKDHCERQNIRNMALVMEQDCAEDASNDDKHLDANNNDKPISVIASQHVTSNSTLLQLLESRFNIQLYERDYSLLKLNPSLAFSDVDVDENTAIIIEDVGKLREDRSLHSVVTRIVSLSLKYTTCYCLFYKDKASSTGYLYPGHVIANIGKLQAAAVNFERRSKSNYNAKIMLCPDMNEMAVIIRKICEERLTSSVDMDNTLDRSWMSTDITKEEKFLLQNPCISSFNAQVLLKAVGLKGILAGNLEQLTKAVPGIANTTLLGICESIQQVRDNIPCKSATDDDVSRPSIPNDAPTNQKPTSNNNSNAIKAVHNATRSHIQAEGVEQQRDDYTQPRDGPEHDAHMENIASIQHHKNDSDKYNGYQDSGTKDNFNRKHGESINSSNTEKRQVNLYEPQKVVKSVNDRETPSSHDFASLMQHPGSDRENIYQNLIQATSGRSQLMAMKQGLRTATPSKKARRHLEFEPIGLSEVERSFRQQFGSSRTPLKVDSRPNTSHPDLLKSEANRPNTSQPEMLKSEATGKKDGERLRDLPLDPRDQHFPFSDLRRLEQQLDRRDTLHDSKNIHQALDPKLYAEKENTILMTTEPFTIPAVVQTTSLYQNIVGQSVQTFDYNHGIPKQQESHGIPKQQESTVPQRNDANVIAKPCNSSFNQAGVTKFCNNTINIKQHRSQEDYTSSNMPHRQRFLDSMTAFDMEYPPADQIDRLVCSNESNHNTKMFPDSSAGWNNVRETNPSGRENMYDYTNTFTGYQNSKTFLEVADDKFESQFSGRYSNYEREQTHSSNLNSLNNTEFTTHQYLHSPMPKQDLIRYLNTPDHFSTDHDIPTALQPLSQNSVDCTREQAHHPIDKSVRFSDGLFQRPTISTNSEPYGNYNGAINDSPFNKQNVPSTLQILPQATDPLTEQNTQKKKMNSNKTFFNPCMERLTLRPMCIPAADTINTVNNPNMEDANSQEAFMKLLQYSQQLPRFGCVASRYPIQRKSIGLAQPLQRTKVADDNKIRQDNTETRDQNQTRETGNQTRDQTSNQTSNQTRQAENQMREEHQRDSQQTNNTVNYNHTSREKENVRRRNSDPAPMWSSEHRRRMLQSPWATEGSPPMDIDYEDSQINRVLHSNDDSQKFSNRCVFTGATPDKKRRLSYEKIPGRKGQTKLIFQ